jgi:hypothetical protein
MYAMLSNLYLKYQVTRLWLDIVCINQNDPDKKSEQVPIIGEIYRKATKVYDWLGEVVNGDARATFWVNLWSELSLFYSL